MDHKNGLTSYAKQKSWLREGVFDMLGPQPPGDQISFRNRSPFPVKMMSFLRLGNRPVSTLVKKLQSAKVREGSAKRNAKLMFSERARYRSF